MKSSTDGSIASSAVELVSCAAIPRSIRYLLRVFVCVWLPVSVPPSKLIVQLAVTPLMLLKAVAAGSAPFAAVRAYFNVAVSSTLPYASTAPLIVSVVLGFISTTSAGL